MGTKNKEAETTETHSSGPHKDPVNSSEDRLAADPALEPGMANNRQDEADKDRVG